MSSPFDSNPYAHRPGCPFCSIVATPFPRSDALDTSAASSSSFGPAIPYTPWRRDSDNSSVTGVPVGASSHSSTTNVIIYKDANITAFVEKKFPVSSKGHVIIVLNLHVPSIYSLSSSDLPLLNHINNTATQLLHSLNPPIVPSSPTPGPRTTAEEAAANRVPLNQSVDNNPPYHIGFITPPFKDNKIPITDHLHCHAYIGTPDLAGWWRGVAYGNMGWYPIQDLIAEIRETVTNNRVKSGYTNRPTAPIDMVPSAGAVSGGADGTHEYNLPLPLQANKAHLSPVPTGFNGLASESSAALLGEAYTSATSRNSSRAPTLTISAPSGVETFDQNDSPSVRSGMVAGGSVDLGSFIRVNEDDYEPDTATQSTFGGVDHDSQRPSSAGHRPRESFDEAAWEGMDGSTGSYEGEEGQAGPGPSTIRTIASS